MKIFIGLITGVALLLATGCGSASLTRAKATALIEAKKETGPFELSKEQCQKGVQLGYWESKYETDSSFGQSSFGHYSFLLTDLGKKMCDVKEDMRYGGEPCGYYHPLITLRQPITRKVLEVTGITGDERNKVVEVKWRWNRETLPDDLKGIVEDPSQSEKVNFQLYDDGWRIVRVD